MKGRKFYDVNDKAYTVLSSPYPDRSTTIYSEPHPIHKQEIHRRLYVYQVLLINDKEGTIREVTTGELCDEFRVDKTWDEPLEDDE